MATMNIDVHRGAHDRVLDPRPVLVTIDVLEQRFELCLRFGEGVLGMLEIRRLRTLAEEKLGDNFDIRQFHDRVLENGSITLPMLEAAVLAWIEDSR